MEMEVNMQPNEGKLIACPQRHDTHGYTSRYRNISELRSIRGFNPTMLLVTIVLLVPHTLAMAADSDAVQVDSGYVSDSGDNHVPLGSSSPADECAILNQVQSVVIQILNTHYEYGRGIHMLHQIVDGIQDDFSALKDGLTELGKQVYSSKSTSEHGNYSVKLGTSQRQRHGDDVSGDKFPSSGSPDIWSNERLSQTMDSVQGTLRNLTHKVERQTQQYHALDKKYVRLRRKLKRVLEGPRGATEIGSHGRADDKGAMMDHYMNKQTDINTKLLRRIQDLEQRLKARDDQNDAPSAALVDGCPVGFHRHYTSCYKFGNDTKNWVEAEKMCQGYHPQAHLVSIETTQEAEYLVQYRMHNTERWGSNYIWTGGSDMAAEGQWRWVGTSQIFSYRNWRPGQPDNHAGVQHCVYLRADGSDPRWDDWHCHAARLNYVCEVNMGAD